MARTIGMLKFEATSKTPEFLIYESLVEDSIIFECDKPKCKSRVSEDDFFNCCWELDISNNGRIMEQIYAKMDKIIELFQKKKQYTNFEEII